MILFSRVFLGLELVFLLSTQINAQIVPDSTLGTENSVVSPAQIIKGLHSDRIDGGARRGTNLFHSFEKFNLEGERAAYFANPAGVENILSRVTGGNPSEILGRLGVLGNANLFFLNPNGIIFGPNASLDLNGSFLATTASSLHFSDGTVFRAKNPQPVPLLEVSVPIGLGLTEPSGTIQVQGRGHNLIAPGDTRLPNVPFEGPIPTGLAVGPERTLALVGGDVILTGGIVTAPSGRIEIGSVASGQVKISFTSSNNFSLGYEGVLNFQELLLAKQSLLNASGLTNGNIQIFARNIDLTDASLIFIENQGANPLGAIEVNASNALRIRGTTEFTPLFPGQLRLTRGLVTQALFEGKGADIDITANQLVVQDSGRIYLSTFGSGPGGELRLLASEFVEIGGISPFDSSFPLSSLVATGTSGSGKAGNLELTTKKLSLTDGGLLNSTVFGNGIGGDLRLDASESIELTGFNPNSFVPSLISSITQGAGRGGNLSLNTKELTLIDGGRVDTSTLADGAAGSLIINATERISVSGTIPGSINPSLITASANRVDPVIREGLELPESPTGASGNVTINTSVLRVTDGGLISVRNDGSGDAGKIQIQANSIALARSGGINASTQSGEGGNIAITSREIGLRNESEISAAAGGIGNGGNISINADTLVVLEGSQISANAFQGTGGNIQISALGVFVSPDSSLTASSELGIDGTVEINTPETNLQKELEQLSANLIPTEEMIAKSCFTRRNQHRGTFVNTGTGGLPITPETAINEFPVLDEAQTSPRVNAKPPMEDGTPESPQPERVWISSVAPWKPGEPMIQGQKIIRTTDGRTLLVAAASPEDVQSAQYLICR